MTKPKLVILPTIDVEGSHGSRPFEQLVLGNIGASESWGVHKIANILKRYNVVGTFFVDVYEHTFWGMEAWEQVCVKLVEQGQDVQLHTHPGWRTNDTRDRYFPELIELKRTKSFFSHKKYLMAHLTLQEQIDMLNHGIELLEKWLGVRPIAHRCGEYAVNEDTIKALQKVGIKVDSSQNRANKQTKIAWSFNKLIKKHDVLEIPVTVYKRSFLPFEFNRVKTTFLTKTDLSYPFNDLIGFCEAALNTGLPVMNLFMHSSSLLKMNKYVTQVSPNSKSVHNLEKIVQWGQHHPEVEIMSIAHYYQSGLWRNFLSPTAPDIVPRFTCPSRLMQAILKGLHNTIA